MLIAKNPILIERYRYPCHGQRLFKVSGPQQIRYLAGLELWHQPGSGKASCLHVLTLDDIRLLQRPGQSTVKLRYCSQDRGNSRRLELDAAAKVISRECFYPFGGSALWAAGSATASVEKTLRHAGKERDASGLYYYGFRYYAPWLLRWLNPDPASTVDGLSLFSLVGNNPLTWCDADGRAKISGGRCSRCGKFFLYKHCRTCLKQEPMPPSAGIPLSTVPPKVPSSPASASGSSAESADTIELSDSESTKEGAASRPLGAVESDLRGPGTSGLQTPLSDTKDRRKYACERCDNRYTTKTNLTAHSFTTHGVGSGFPCTKCGRVLGKNSTLKTHMKNHLGQLPYKCDQCDMAFSMACRLTAHKNTEHSDYEFVCLCDYSISHEKCTMRCKQRKLIEGHLLRVHKIKKDFANYYSYQPKTAANNSPPQGGK